MFKVILKKFNMSQWRKKITSEFDYKQNKINPQVELNVDNSNFYDKSCSD